MPIVFKIEDPKSVTVGEGKNKRTQVRRDVQYAVRSREKPHDIVNNYVSFPCDANGNLKSTIWGGVTADKKPKASSFEDAKSKIEAHERHVRHGKHAYKPYKSERKMLNHYNIDKDGLTIADRFKCRKATEARDIIGNSLREPSEFAGQILPFQEEEYNPPSVAPVASSIAERLKSNPRRHKPVVRTDGRYRRRRSSRR